jgi:hypothetical protein
MAHELNRRWGLALGAVLTEMNSGYHHELGGWGAGDHTGKWCRDALSRFWGVDDRDSHRQALAYLWHTGHRTEVQQRLRAMPDPSEDDAKGAIVRANAASLRGRGVLAWDLGRFVAVLGWGTWAGYATEAEAWPMIQGAATWAQRRYLSWEEFGRGYELGRLFWSEGEEDPRIPDTLHKLLTEPKSPWVQLAWATPL